MMRPDPMTTIAAFFVAVILMATMALAYNQSPADYSGAYLPSIHCKTNTKIAGCIERVASEPAKSIGVSYSIPLIAFIAGASIWVIWRIRQLPDPDDRGKILIGIVVGVILWVGKHLLFKN